MPLGATRDVRLGDLGHRDGGLHARRGAGLLEEVLQRERVHDGAEHAHVVGPAAVHAALAELRAAEEVASADDDRDLDAVDGRGDLAGHLADDVGIDAELAAAERLTGELQEDAPASGGLI